MRGSSRRNPRNGLLSGRLAPAVSRPRSPENRRPAAGLPPSRRRCAAEHRTRSLTSPRPTAEAPPSEGVQNAEGAPIFERMVFEWLMDPTALEVAPAGHGPAPPTPDGPPPRTRSSSRSGTPNPGCRSAERGARRGARATPRRGSDLPAPTRGRDPAAIGDILSRALAGVRSGRAESDAPTAESKETNEQRHPNGTVESPAPLLRPPGLSTGSCPTSSATCQVCPRDSCVGRRSADGRRVPTCRLIGGVTAARRASGWSCAKRRRRRTGCLKPATSASRSSRWTMATCW